MRRAALFLLLALAAAGWSRAQELPRCGDRPTFIDPPWVDGRRWCLEEALRDEPAGELAFTALAAAPDGTLYAARPLHGLVLALRDTTGDGLPDSAQVAAAGLTLPNGLAYHDESLYISGGRHIYRLAGGSLEILVDDLPSGAGFWTGGIAVGDDRRLYVAVGAPCDFCEPDDPERGAILSFNLDGGDRRIVAGGLRRPVGLAFVNGALWTADTARDGLAGTPNLDELNRVTPGAHFGWPYCVGRDNRPDWPSAAFDCAAAVRPALALPTHSGALALAAYTGGAFAELEDTLLVALGGSYNQAALAGYALAVVRFDSDGQPTGYEVILPEQADKNNPPGLTLADIQYQGSGLWPRRPLGVTVSAEGWVYLSVGGGRILALRPR